MEGAINLLDNIAQSENEYMLRALNALNEHQSFHTVSQNSEGDNVVASLNSMLNTPNSRTEAFIILESFVLQCSTNILEQKGSLWLSICLKHSHAKQNHIHGSLAAKIISTIIIRSVAATDLQKNLSSTLIPKIIETAINSPSDASFFLIIKSLLQHYPAQCGSSRQLIIKKLWTFVDSTNVQIVADSAKCFHFLQQVRGGGVQGISHKNMWTQYHLQLLGSIHEYFNLLFANTVESSDVSGVADRFNIPDITLNDEPLAKASQLAVRCENLISYLRTTLLQPFSTSKSIHAVKVLNIIIRGLSVNCTTLAKNAITDNIAVGLLLPSIHIKLLKLLDALIFVCGSNLLPYTKTITHALVQSLAWTNNSKTAKKPFSQLRIATYDVLQNWIKCSNYNSVFESIADQLIESLLHDIKTHKSEVTLKAVQGARKHLSKKARRNLQKAQNDQSNISKDYGTGKNEIAENVDQKDAALCAKALECLGTIILLCGSFLKPNIHKLLHETVVVTSYAVFNGILEKNNVYTNWKCRVELLRCLTNLILSCHSLVPAPLQYALQILTVSQRHDPNKEVQNVSRTLLSSLEKIIHPQKESLDFRREEDDDTDDNSDMDIDVGNNESIGHIQTNLDEIEKTLDNIIDENVINESDTESDQTSKLRMTVSPIIPSSTQDEADSTDQVEKISMNDIVILSNELIIPSKEISSTTLIPSVLDKPTNGNNSTIEVEDNDPPTRPIHSSKRRSNQLETIEIDSDENDNDDVLEVVDVIEPRCKKVRVSEVTSGNIIDCDDVDDVLQSFEADFNDELNVHVIAD